MPISGVVDLVHLTADLVEVVDYKTDATRRAHEEYRKQLRVNYPVLASVYEDREVTASIFYTESNELVDVNPIPLEGLEEVVGRARADLILG